MIAIDTPHMMEEEGKYNERRNFCHRTGEMIKMALEKARPQRMLVLFVPLKCERYLKDNKMDKVLTATMQSYEELIRYFKKIRPSMKLLLLRFLHLERHILVILKEIEKVVMSR